MFDEKIMSTKRKHSSSLSSKSQSLESIPWIEEFSPKTIDELAVHKKKTSEVQTWLQNCFSSCGSSTHPQILLLTGPPGAGKTATVKVLCDILGAELFVWSNTQQEKSAWKQHDDFLIRRDSFVGTYENQTSAFSRFLLHSVKYSLFSNDNRIILIEEIPNALIRSPTDFHSILRKYSLNGKFPIVFIISDNARGESLESTLFPKDLQSILKIMNISFNPIAPTMLMKVLAKINSSSKVDPTYSRLNKKEIEDIISDSAGDIRNAINTMQFLCMTQFKKPMPVSKRPSTKNETSLECDSKKNSSLFLFHALGKILYSKRDPSLKSASDNLPDHLKHLEKDPLVSNAEDVYDRTSISADAFSLFLQENYLDFVADVNVLSECSRWLSDADVLSAYWSDKETMLDYSASLAARGLMFNFLPSTSGKRWKPLHKPQFYENNSKKNRCIYQLKYAFQSSPMSMRELQIDFLPFVSKLNKKSFNSAQVCLANELGEMNVKRTFRPTSKPLNEKDYFEIDTDDCDMILEDSSKNLNTNLPESDTYEDEEIIIEEYDY